MGGIPFLVGGVSTGFLVGSVFGTRHALEADHIAAVATLINNEQQPGRTGAAWGIGHSLPIIFLGAFFIILDLQVPEWFTTGFELIVVAILVALGLRVILGREPLGITFLRHMHGGFSREETTRGHLHVTLGDRLIGLTHSHVDEESMAVGIIHGLAGSGGVVVILAAAAPTTASGAAFLIGFTLASVTAMGIATWTWGQIVGHTDKLRIAAGIASIAVGTLLFAEIIGHGLPF